jgi:Mg2+ and Co2+ transporter CorA
MISRGDVLASIKLAEVARDNSSSMKVVAIMTMAFLPATFFAALFSVPSLKWDAETVVTDRFWVFWAFTLPSTLLIFALWAGITRQQLTPAAWENPWKDMRTRMATLLADSQ